MYKFLALSLGLLLILPLFLNIDAGAESSHPNLFVSAENSSFQNHFSGSMVVEVVIRDSDISDTDEGKGEPDVTINGKNLRMVQGSDGNWYAYFANMEKAKQADQIALGGVAGESLDFGVFCAASTDVSVLGIDISETEGVSIPSSNGIQDSTNGTSSFNACNGSPTGPPPNKNNVLRNAKSPNTNGGMPVGQIGLDEHAWPLIQLFSFSNDVTIIYNKGGGAQRVDLNYSDIPNISLNIDRNGYPTGAEVFVTVNDMQLNQDPTDVDSWTFNINSTRTTFYQAFTESGSDSGNGDLGLVNLNPYLGSLGFEKNGNLGMNLGSVAVAILKTNQYQPSSFVTTGTTRYNNIVTLVESEPNSGIFYSFDYDDNSVIGISNSAPRGQSASIEYNSKTTSIVTGDSTATLSIGINSAQFNPGQKATITLVDNDQNVNPGADEDLDVFRSTAIIPTLQIGNPFTIKTGDRTFFTDQDVDPDSAVPGDVDAVDLDEKDSTALDDSPITGFVQAFSQRAMLDPEDTVADTTDLIIDFGGRKISDLTKTIRNPDGTFDGFDMFNYDARSLGITGGQWYLLSSSDRIISDEEEGDTGVTAILLATVTSAQGLINLNDGANEVFDGSDVTDAIFAEPADNFVGLLFSYEDEGAIDIDTDTIYPIVADFFSVGTVGDGIKPDDRINNVIYRAELEETSANSGMFTGTIEYVVTNQLNQFDPNLIKSLRTISNEIKFLINDELSDEDAINLAYSDIAKVGVPIGISAKTEIKTQTASVTLE